MGWAEIGLGPRAETRESERRSGPGGGGSVVVDPGRAKAHLQAVRGEFWSHGVWLAAVVVLGVIAMAVEGASGAPLAIAVVIGVAATGILASWFARLVRWWRLSST